MRLLVAGEDAELARLARVLGYEEGGPEAGDRVVTDESPRAPPESIPDRLPTALPDVQAEPLAAARFWFLSRCESVGQEIADRIAAADSGPTDLPVWASDPGRQPDPVPLARWRELMPRLRDTLAVPIDTRMPDVPAIVRCLGSGRSLSRLPRRRRRQWGPSLTVIEDRSDRLMPYWADQRAITDCLASLFPRHAFRRGLIWESLGAPVSDDPDAPALWPPPPGSQILVLGDLGCLAPTGGAAAILWGQLGDELADLDCRALAVSPAPADDCAAQVASRWGILPWERHARAKSPSSLRVGANRLLTALSPASRIEPGLLRDLRLILGLPAATESLVWQHRALQSRHSIAGTLRAADALRLREDFTTWGRDEQAACLRRLHAWRGGLPREIWFAEIEGLQPELRGRLAYPEDAEQADDYFAALGRRLHGVNGSSAPAGLLPWYRFVAPRLRPGHERDPRLGIHFQRLYRAAYADARRAPSLADYDPALAGGLDKDATSQLLDVCQRGDHLLLQPRQSLPSDPCFGSPLGRIELVHPEILISPRREEEDRDGFWESGQPPAWARNWGWDDYGAWVDFSIPDKDGQLVTQRMRWIEPGTFRMGSPEDEPERYSDEGPQHAVTIREGFWLFDTACTQALWEAVMGGNPSHFKDADRPVEQVSWEDVQHFIKTINTRVPGLELSLPSEVQWEYACSAGTVTPFSFGSNITPDQVNYNGDYPYAGGPTGLNRKETIPVKALPPNGWGLYQMHGNVFEWVQDAWHANYEGAPTDGSAWETAEAGANRVFRGGSWLVIARDCRSAYRDDCLPDDRDDDLGFRPARGQVREPGRPEAERAELARPGPRSGSGRGGTDPARGAGQERAAAVLLRLDTGASATAELPDAPALEIRTDRETLILHRCATPAWAGAMGRDRFGLWADLTIADSAGEPVIQRLRWIPPGRFLMGSPADEPGRWDVEGPQHPVTIGQGFWLFDTPCTQALWVALGLRNPSRFRDPARPVEQVSWDDIQQQFLPALNERIAGFILPSEAQWEYACRAGTQTALYTGPIEIRGDMDAPTLDPIAWYGGNSGVDYDLAEGDDTTSGPWWSGKQKQYPHQRAGTRQVKGKLPNPWGLYDMLGNVWEWTRDSWHENYEGAPSDGSAWETPEAGAGRVIRGGSWDDGAGDCRSAYRGRDGPDVRLSNLGFRCARAQV
jgi:formylglycine-generating enzyme required for sulfatase activity